MTSEEIKQTTTMAQVLDRYGIKVRRNMCSCPFHGADTHPSMRVYKDGYNCFACGANGDIFKFVQEYEKCDFKTAFQLLGGTYEHASTEAEKKRIKRQIARSKARAESEQRRERRAYLERKENNALITKYRKLIDLYEPMSDEWADAMNNLVRQLQIHEELNP